MIVGVLIGGAISKKVDASLFKKALDGALVAVGVMLWI
jgi:triosephosphate isomerase